MTGLKEVITVQDLTDDERQMLWSVVAAHGEKFMILCRKAAGNEHDAEALFSDEVLRMLPARIRTWDGSRPFINYAANYFALHLRKIVARQRAKQVSSYDDHEAKLLSIADPGFGNGSTVLKQSAIVEAVQLLLEDLTVQERIVVWQSWAEGVPIRQVADIVSWSPTAVQVKLTKLRPKLLAMLKEMGFDYDDWQ